MKKSAWLTALMALLAAMVMAGPANAQTQQEGLVNVNLQDIDIGVPIAVAANICDVNANVIAEQRRLGQTACEATAESGAVFGPGRNNGGAQQNGLVNVNVSDVTVKVPISVAANICDVNVNVLAQQRERGRTTCDAVAESQA